MGNTERTLLFIKEGQYETAKKINRLDKVIDSEVIDEIDKGVTSERLLQLEQQGIPIFKYKTQITIHGLHNDPINMRFFGYTNVFLNQNKSMGVRWSAIDGGKRNDLEKVFRLFGFGRSRTASLDYFYMKKEFNDENLKFIKSIHEKIDASLFYGNAYMWKINLWGIYYIFLEIHINAILEENIKPLLDGMGYTEAVIKAEIKRQEEIEKQRQIEREKANEEYRLFALELKKKEAEVLENNKEIWAPLLKFPKANYKQIPGHYIEIVVDPDTLKINFIAHAVIMPPRARVTKRSFHYFNNLDDAMVYEYHKISGEKFYGTLKGVYKVK